jgi:hypothetical protein
MAVTELFELDGVTVSTTELSITNNATYSAGSNKTSDNAVQLWLDTTNMAKADEFEVRLYEKVEATGGSARLVQVWRLLGAQATNFVTPVFLLMHGWDFTIKRIAGSDRAFDASVRSAG